MPTLYFIQEIMKFSVVANIIFKKISSFVLKYRGRDDTIVGRVVDQAVDQTRVIMGAEAESSQIRAG